MSKHRKNHQKVGSSMPQGDYISLDAANAIVAEINAIQPPISPWGEQCVAAYTTTSATDDVQEGGERAYNAVWPSNYFSSVCQDVAERIASKMGDWVAGMRQEYTDYVNGHLAASQWGLPPGVIWTNANTGVVIDPPASA